MPSQRNLLAVGLGDASVTGVSLRFVVVLDVTLVADDPAVLAVGEADAVDVAGVLELAERRLAASNTPCSQRPVVSSAPLRIPSLANGPADLPVDDHSSFVRPQFSA